MSIALKGFLTGAFKAIDAKMEQERNDTRELLATRTKNAYQNYLAHQETTNALKDEIKQRDAKALQYQPDLTEQERVAIASMPNAIDLYEKALGQGMKISLRDVVRVNPKAENISFNDFVNKIGKVDPVAMQFQEPKSSFFGVSAEGQQRQFSKMAGAVGVAPETLAAYEKLPEKPSVLPTGSIDFAKLQKPKGLNERIEELTTSIVDKQLAKQDYAADQAELDQLLEAKGKVLASQLDPDQKRQRRKVELMNTIESNASTPEQKKAAKDELLRMANSERMYVLASSVRDTTGDKPASMAQFKNVVSMAAANAAKTVSGPGAKLVNINPDPYSAPIYTIDGSPDAKNAFKKEFERLIGITLTAGGYVDNNGRLRDNDYAAVLSATGINVAIKEDGGRYFAPEVKSVAQKAREDGSSIPKIVAALKRNFSEAELLEEGFHPEEINEAKSIIQQQSGGGVSTKQSPSFSTRSLEEKNKIDAAKKKGYVPVGRSGNQIIFEDAKGTRAFESDIL